MHSTEIIPTMKPAENLYFNATAWKSIKIHKKCIMRMWKLIDTLMDSRPHRVRRNSAAKSAASTLLFVFTEGFSSSLFLEMDPSIFIIHTRIWNSFCK